jgi:hypothetical protein
MDERDDRDAEDGRVHEQAGTAEDESLAEDRASDGEVYRVAHVPIEAADDKSLGRDNRRGCSDALDDEAPERGERVADNTCIGEYWGEVCSSSAYLGPGGAVVHRGPDGRQIAFSGQQFRQLFAASSTPVASDAVFSLLDELNRRLVDVQADLAAEQHWRRGCAHRLRAGENVRLAASSAPCSVAASGVFAAILG